MIIGTTRINTLEPCTSFFFSLPSGGENMPNTFGKNLNLCFKKKKFPLTSQSSSSLPETSDDDSLRPLTSSAATASSPLFKNYNSLYDNAYDYSSTSKSLTHSLSLSFEPDPEPELNFATVFASRRFFFTSPGSSNSIIESTPSSLATTPGSLGNLLASTSSPINNANQSSSDEHDHHATTVENSVAVPTFSPNPYTDFRRSMQEMVEARNLIDVKANWEYLHELLLCYLALNPESTHKFIIGAFADVLVSLMADAGDGGGNDGNNTEITGGKIPEQCM